VAPERVHNCIHVSVSCVTYSESIRPYVLNELKIEQLYAQTFQIENSYSQNHWSTVRHKEFCIISHHVYTTQQTFVLSASVLPVLNTDIPAKCEVTRDRKLR